MQFLTQKTNKEHFSKALLTCWLVSLSFFMLQFQLFARRLSKMDWFLYLLDALSIRILKAVLGLHNSGHGGEVIATCTCSIVHHYF